MPDQYFDLTKVKDCKKFIALLKKTGTITAITDEQGNEIDVASIDDEDLISLCNDIAEGLEARNNQA